VYSKPVCPTAAAGHARCLAYVVTTRAGVPKVSLQSVSGYGPAQFQTAYGLTAAAQAQTNEGVAIVDAYANPNAKSDLDTYSPNWGLPILPTCTGQSNVGCFRKVNQTGGTTPPTGDTGWGLEIALDLDAAHAVCPKWGILLVEANSNSFSDLLTAEDYATS